MRWFINRPIDSGPVYYRHTLPLRHLMPRLRDLGVKVTYSDTLDMEGGHDAYFFSRWVGAEYLPLLIELKRRGKVLVWDLDDDLFGLERYEAKRRDKMAMRIRALELCLDMADVITVSTEALRDRTRRPEKTIVCPNLIDLADNPAKLYEFKSSVILYAGSPSHKWDAELLRDLHRRTQREFSWVWYGIKPDFLTANDTWIPWGRVSDYPRVCRLVNPCVCLAPLIPDRFNLSKSGIKVWESATLGASVIASNYGSYTGSAAAIVPAGEPFRLDHLGKVLRRPNNAACLAEARANSWQHSESGPRQWLSMFNQVLSLCPERTHDHANQLPGAEAA